MTVYSERLFRSSNRLYSTVGGLSLASILSSLFSGITGQHFYPQEHTLGIWAAIFLMSWFYVEEARVQNATLNADDPGTSKAFRQQQVAIFSANG